jgi:hypothetical protein
MLSILLASEPGELHANFSLEGWKNRCIAVHVQGAALPAYLRFNPSAASGLIDLIAVCPGRFDVSFANWAREIIEEIRALPESCCMFDGRKWKRMPCVVLSDLRYPPGFEVLQEAGIPVIHHAPQFPWTRGRAFKKTVNRWQEIVTEYQKRVLAEFEKAGMLVAYEHGRFRVKWAFRKKDPYSESEYYHAGSDRRKLKDYVTVHREIAGIAHDAELFEELINDPNTRETELQKFLEGNPAFLMDIMQGVPIAHKPRFALPRGQTPDFVIPPVAALGNTDSVKVVELKGVHEQLLTGKLHRVFSHAVHQAIGQVRDYARYIEQHDSQNEDGILQVFGYLPRKLQQAVVIGRSPATESDRIIRETRAADELEVLIVSYDEILQTQRQQL